MKTTGIIAPASPSHSGQASPGAGPLLGMGACYALGTFTDNFYKQAAILLAAATGMTGMQSTATVLFSLPFILFSAWAGAVADRVAKKSIIIAVKSLELLALLFGGLMLLADNWTGILLVMFLMGTQSTFFSPAINGSIPENFPPALVPRANSLIKLAATAAILAGMATAGFALDIRETSFGGILPDLGLHDAAYGRVMAAGVVAVIALLGLLTAFLLRKKPAALPPGERPSFPWTGPLDSVKHTWACRKDKPLMLVILADAWFYGIAAIAVISIANLAAGLAFSKSTAGLLTALLMIGVAAGSLVAGRFPADSWRFLLVPSAVGMAVMLTLVGATPLLPASANGAFQFAWFGAALFLTGVCGGLYIIPLESYIQVRPAPDAKGRVIAVSNFTSFMAMALFGAAFSAVSLLPAAGTFVLYGLATFCFCHLYSASRLRKLDAENLRESASSFLGFILRIILFLRYRVTEEGLDALPPAGDARKQTGNGAKKPGILILPNHPALIDPVIIYSRLAGLKPRPLSDEAQMRGFAQRIAARVIRAVTIPDLAKVGRKGRESVRQGLEAITAALQAGDNILLYPSGQVYRSSREAIGGKAAVAHILAAAPEARVVLVRTRGLWGSGFSHASGKAPRMTPLLLRGLLTILGNAILFAPRRDVHIEYAEPDDLPRGADKAALNRYLERFYNEAEMPPVFVPRFFWRKRRETAEPLRAAATRRIQDETPVPDEVRQGVYAMLREKAGLADNAPIEPRQALAADLFLDSLALMETVMELEETFGHPVGNPELLLTVNDCLLAATGKLGDSFLEAPQPAPPAWREAEKQPGAEKPPDIPRNARSIVEAFFRTVQKNPDRPLTAERSGLRTRRDLCTGVLALAKRFAAIPGTRLGIMLPAIPASLAVWIAAMHAGKEPVFINWTVGRRNLEHCLASSGITHAVTATALLDQLERASGSVADLPVTWVAADTLATALTKGEKIRAALLARLHCSPLPFSIRPEGVKETAAILFTSGSESMPKAVPLTHANIMRNASDLLRVLNVRGDDRLLAMLPPFHSFGLLVGLALPASTGIAAAYHPNPTESAALLSLVRDYTLTLFGTTPTFLEGMLARTGAGEALASLRHVFAGAEKCPDRVYKAFAERCPGASLCEGYGITECSPVVAVNRPGDVVPGSVGRLLPSVEGVVMVESDGAQGRKAGHGETGMLLVRGPSVFSGYLAAPDATPPNPFVAYDGAFWYRTGDLVSMDETGRLFFKGRLKRFVKLGGEMISLPQMEDVLQKAFAAVPGAPGDGSPYIAVEVRRGSEEEGQAELVAFTTLAVSPQEVNLALRRGGLSPLCGVRRVVKLETIPLLGTGKVNYRELAACL